MKTYDFDSLKFATEGLSGGACTVIQDDVGLPSFMIAINQRTNAQLFEGGSQKTHSAFMVDDVEYKRFFISKFLNCVINGRAYSWPLMDPKAVINYDDSMAACNAKGNGWHLMSIPERAVIDHLIYKSGLFRAEIHSMDTATRTHTKPENRPRMKATAAAAEEQPGQRPDPAPQHGSTTEPGTGSRIGLEMSGNGLPVCV